MTEDQESAALSDDGSAVDRLFEWATLYEARIYCGALWHERNGWRRRALAAEAEREQAQVLVDALRREMDVLRENHRTCGDDPECSYLEDVIETVNEFVASWEASHQKEEGAADDH